MDSPWCLPVVRYPSWHLNSLTARDGCVILELDVVQRKRQQPTNGDLAPQDLDLAEWLNMIKPEGIANGTGNAGEKTVCIKVGQISDNHCCRIPAIDTLLPIVSSPL